MPVEGFMLVPIHAKGVTQHHAAPHMRTFNLVRKLRRDPIAADSQPRVLDVAGSHNLGENGVRKQRHDSLAVMLLRKSLTYDQMRECAPLFRDGGRDAGVEAAPHLGAEDLACVQRLAHLRSQHVIAFQVVKP